MRVKIAHIIYSFGEGGMENGLVNIVNRLNPSDFYHVICCLTKSGVFESRLQGNHFSVYELNKKKGNDLTLPFKLKTILKENEIDIVHLRGWPTLLEGIIGAKLAGVKKIIYGFHGKTFQEIGRWTKKRIYAERLAMKFVDQIVTLSEPMRDSFCLDLGIGTDRVNVIHNGVDLIRFVKQKDIRKFRSSLGIKKNEFVLGFVGRLDPVKNCATLLHAYAILVEKLPESKLILVGEGEEEETLKRLANKLGLHKRVIFAGSQKNVCDFLNCMDVYVQSSLYEGFSNTLIEAMAVGLPVVATTVGGNAVLISEGKNGFLVRARSPVLLSERILFLANNPIERRQISECNMSTIRNRFSIKKMISGYEDCYLSGRIRR